MDPGSCDNGFESNKDCNDNNMVDISIIVVHFGPLQVPYIDKHTFPYPSVPEETYKFG